jgi:hypothetical protein
MSFRTLPAPTEGSWFTSPTRIKVAVVILLVDVGHPLDLALEVAKGFEGNFLDIYLLS